MAIVTLRIQLRRTEGRRPVDDHDLARVVAELVEDLEDIEVDDIDGNPATYTVTRTDLLITQPALAPVEAPEPARCLQCGAAITTVPGHRPRQYCSPACRQTAHRLRHPTIPRPPTQARRFGLRQLGRTPPP